MTEDELNDICFHMFDHLDVGQLSRLERFMRDLVDE